MKQQNGILGKKEKMKYEQTKSYNYMKQGTSDLTLQKKIKRDLKV